MAFLLDTNVVSKLGSRRPHGAVLARNVADFSRFEVPLLSPFTAA